MAAEFDMSESDAGSVALAVTEAATNIARYGREGMIILRNAASTDMPVVEMIAVDNGPGIRDVGRAIADGFSTGGTSGEGLGAINRMASEFDIWSEPGCGTAIVARFGTSQKKTPLATMTIGVVCTALAGEAACGDAWLVEPIDTGVLVAVVDGLGHGPDAAIAAGSAIQLIQRNKTRSPVAILAATNAALRPTRGAAVQIAIIDLHAGTVRSAGAGNISTSVMAHEKSKSIPSQPGIVGHQMPKVREVVVPWTPGSMLAMHSDGISARWAIDTYPGLRLHDPALAAAVIYRDFARTRDDATMLVIRGATS